MDAAFANSCVTQKDIKINKVIHKQVFKGILSFVCES